jgi:ATP-dependent Clp protease adaptor protein ClpS
MHMPFSAGPEAPLAEPEVGEQEETSSATDVPWNVVVHNDPITKMNYVTMVFQKIFRMPKEKAERHMMEVHQRGRSILWSGVREKAEFYVQQLHVHQLLATLERAL